MRRRITGVILALCLAASLGSAVFVPAGAADDYPDDLKNEAKDELVDPWSFYNRECTSFVAWCLNSRNDVAFTNWYGGVRWGNANNWGEAARSVGITVDRDPAVGSVAWTDKGAYGHVAWVAAVDGSTVTIEEYNRHGSGNWSTRTVAATDFSGYIHVKDMTPPPLILNMALTILLRAVPAVE